jgi:N-acyl-D-aspartate/D-glutamate deacylase
MDGMSFDTIIKGGTVVDGSGLPKRVADVGIRDGMVTDIGRLSGAKRTIHADGLVVMPGIIDAHTHYDPQLTFDPFATSSCFHGVTSVVAGNCGYCIAPVKKADHEWVTKLFARVEGISARVLSEGFRGIGRRSRRCWTRSTSASASTLRSTSATRRCVAT